MNKNESARNYIQLSSCDSQQNRESCRDELYKMSRQRWCDKLEVCLHPSSGNTFLSICQLLQLDRGNNHLEHHRCRSIDVLVLVLHSHSLETPRLLMRHSEPNPVCLTTGHKDTPPIWMDRTLRLYGFIKEISRKLQLFSQDSTAPTHILETRLLMRHSEPNPVRLTTGHKYTPPIWMDRTLHLYGFIKEISRKLQLFSQDSTAPTHTLETPRLLMRHNEPNPVCLTTGHKDTPPIWMLRLYDFIKEISRKLPLFSQDSTTPTHILGTPPLLLRHNKPNPVSSTTGHTPLNGLNLAQLSNFLTHVLLDKWDKKPHTHPIILMFHSVLHIEKQHCAFI